MNDAANALNILGTAIEFGGAVCAGLAAEPFAGVRGWLRAEVLTDLNRPGPRVVAGSLGALLNSMLAVAGFMALVYGPFRESTVVVTIAVAVTVLEVVLALGVFLSTWFGGLTEQQLHNALLIRAAVFGVGVLMQLMAAGLMAA